MRNDVDNMKAIDQHEGLQFDSVPQSPVTYGGSHEVRLTIAALPCPMSRTCGAAPLPECTQIAGASFTAPSP